VKVTLDLPAELYRRVESLAVRRGETVTALVVRALTNFVESSTLPRSAEKKRRKKRVQWVKVPNMPGYVQAPEDPALAALSPEERAKRWWDEEMAFLELMRGPDLDPRSAAEIISEGRSRLERASQDGVQSS
jgi:hypothetical protein